MSPRIAFSLVTTRAPIFFARSQSAALLTLASGAIVATSAPFRFRMLSMVIACSHRVALGSALEPALAHKERQYISHRQEAVSEYRRRRDRSAAHKLVLPYWDSPRARLSPPSWKQPLTNPLPAKSGEREWASLAEPLHGKRGGIGEGRLAGHHLREQSAGNGTERQPVMLVAEVEPQALMARRLADHGQHVGQARARAHPGFAVDRL